MVLTRQCSTRFWLVRQHLYMSYVAQNRDIYDPEVVADFAAEVKSQMRLDYLYALTVADINATNPSLWNGWRATLMRHLYSEARRVLRANDEPMDRQASVRAFQESAMEQLQRDLIRCCAARGHMAGPWRIFFCATTHKSCQSARITVHPIEQGAFVAISKPDKVLSKNAQPKSACWIRTAQIFLLRLL